MDEELEPLLECVWDGVYLDIWDDSVQSSFAKGRSERVSFLSLDFLSIEDEFIIGPVFNFFWDEFNFVFLSSFISDFTVLIVKVGWYRGIGEKVGDERGRE